jgi:DNA-binding response OmpR family regulator
MQTNTESAPIRVLLLEPNTALRNAILTVLASEHYTVERCQSLEELLAMSNHDAQAVALVAWQSMEGLLAEEHRHHLVELTRHIRLVLMVPRRWARLLETTDLTSSIAALVAKPFDADELLNKLRSAVAVPVET